MDLRREWARSQRPISTGLAALDSALDGGVPVGAGDGGGVIELVGEAGSGKTQLCLQLVARCQLSEERGGADGDAVVVFAGGAFPVGRLSELVECARSVEQSVSLERVLVRKAWTMEELERVLEEMETMWARVKVLVVDSMAALEAKDASVLTRVAAKLKRVSWERKICVVVVNQVRDLVEDSQVSLGATGKDRGFADGLGMVDSGMQFAVSSGRRVVPALGSGWADAVDLRLFLIRGLRGSTGSGRSKRKIIIAKSNRWKPAAIPFDITNKGLVDQEKDTVCT